MSRSRIIAAAAASAVLSCIVVTPAASAAATAGTLRASTTSVKPSTKVAFTGKLPTKLRRPIVLQRQTSVGWTRVTAGKTSRAGKIALSAISPATPGKYRYRVKAAKAFDGRKRLQAIKTPHAALTVVAPPAAPPAPPAPGSRENPLSINTPFQSAAWRFVVGPADFDAWPEIQAENMFNDPPAPGWSYVMVPVTFTYLGSGTGNPFWDTDLEFVGNDGIVYDEGVNNYYCGVIPNDVSNMGDMFAGATATGNDCSPVPTHAIPGGHWRVSGEAFPTNWVYVHAG